MPAYEIVNMFADHVYAGSALGVVPRAGDLDTAGMQALAREINHTETAFVLPPTGTGADYRVRVFTPEAESPFGGHSSVGTAVTLARLGLIPAGRVVQECGPKLLPLDVSAEAGKITAKDPLASEKLDAGVLLGAVGLPASVAFKAGGAFPAACGFGPAFHFLPVRADAVAAAKPDFDRMAAADLADVLVFSWDPATRTAHGRLFAPGYGMPEDPACSSAALGLGVWLVEAGWLPEGDFTLRQGHEQGRPSTLYGSVQVADGRPVSASVSGAVLPAGTGELADPDREKGS
ncbi:PhzF family phenazine biosynthesis protein [Amycolatopsis sp. NBC_01307]|uniref:PhzF family phenazine biosynthesis protein n=1 Tax=Amycolatopsis sp. NBC_01307 TaxID=2903561 RepID=UPI002E151E62|nr:PhzF family phenazine biosynthesis protein [Amycolatopsis sp. NBC_01307]